MRKDKIQIGIGVDIGGSHIICCAVNLNSGKLIVESLFEKKVDNKASKEDIFKTWAEPINKTIETIGSSNIKGIGFAMPGAFNYKKGIALFEGNDKYEHLYNINIKQEFASYLTLSNIELRFINDATAFAVGVAWFGKAKEYNKSIAIALGTGFGSALIENEIPVVKGEQVPLHGSFWHLPFKDGIADDYFSTRWFVNSYENKTGNKVNGVKEVADAAKNDNNAMQLFREFGLNLGRFLSPWLKRFKPEILVVGGNVSKSWHLIEQSFQQELNKNNLKLNVATSVLMEEAAIIGSAKLLDEEFWIRVKNDLPEI